MKILSLLFLFTIITCSQRQETKKHTPDPRAKKLSDSAVNLAMQSLNNYDKAIALLDQAIQIDSNYYLAYSNKLAFQANLNRFNDALLTAKNLIRIKPQNPDAYTMIGMLYWKTGDTISAMNYFNKATPLIDKILDTMSISNKSYESTLMNQGFNLILIGQQEKGNKILLDLYNRRTDEGFKEMLRDLINKSRKEIINDLFYSDTTISKSEPLIKN